MSMDQDWLDSRLAAESYLPDQGFTARVVSSLPHKPRTVVSLRVVILCGTGLLAFWLFLWQLPPVLQSVGHSLGGRYSVGINLGLLSAELQQPMVLFSLAGILLTVGVGSIPFLRRWV